MIFFISFCNRLHKTLHMKKSINSRFSNLFADIADLYNINLNYTIQKNLKFFIFFVCTFYEIGYNNISEDTKRKEVIL